MAACIDEYGNRFKAGPICKVLSEAPDCGSPTPRGYRMSRPRPVSRMRARHEAPGRDVMDIHAGGSSAVYGCREVRHGLISKGRDPGEAGRDQVMDIMRGLGMRGVRRGKTLRRHQAREGHGRQARPGGPQVRGRGAGPAARGRHHLRARGRRALRVYRIRHRHVRQADRGPGVRHHHEHGGAAPAGVGAGDRVGRVARAGPTASPATAIMACGTPARCTPPG